MLESQKRANKKYIENNPEKFKAICKKYYNNNRDKIRQQQKESYQIKKEIKEFMNILVGYDYKKVEILM